MKCNAKLRPNYFSEYDFVIAVVFHRQIQKTTILPEMAICINILIKSSLNFNAVFMKDLALKTVSYI